MSLDFTTEHGQKTQEMLQNEISIWMVTVSPSGEPQPNPVWFVWEDDSFLIWTLPDSARVANLLENPKVSLSFASDRELDHITVFNGVAEFDDSIPMFLDHEAYMRKYKDEWVRIGMDAVESDDKFTTRLRVRPARLRGY